ncbi:MAG TPA: ATP-binding protein [Streptosporangiaceae bacterium]|nr:ATP-binding protein [Streptosporangiaceae bacterium]
MTGNSPSRPQRHREPPRHDVAQAAGGSIWSGPGVLPILDHRLDSDSLYQLRASVAAHATQAGLPPRRADDLVIAVHELAANVVRHGSGHGRLRIWQHRQAVHCQVTDEGPPPAAGAGGGPETEPGAAPRSGAAMPAEAPPWRVEPGHGLWLVRQLADRTSLHPGPHGTAVTISFTIGTAGAAPPPFTLTQDSRRGCAVLAFTGQLDLSSAGPLADAVDELVAGTPAVRLVLDLAGLTFWDPFGLAALLRAQARVAESPPARMILAAVPGQFTGHLHESGLSGRFTLADTADEVISELIMPPRQSEPRER